MARGRRRHNERQWSRTVPTSGDGGKPGRTQEGDAGLAGVPGRRSEPFHVRVRPVPPVFHHPAPLFAHKGFRARGDADDHLWPGGDQRAECLQILFGALDVRLTGERGLNRA